MSFSPLLSNTPYAQPEGIPGTAGSESKSGRLLKFAMSKYNGSYSMDIEREDSEVNEALESGRENQEESCD